MAVAYRKMGDLAKAEEQWRLITQEVPGFRDGWRGLGEAILLRNDHEGALQLADTLLKDSKLRAVGLGIEASVADVLGEHLVARECLEEALRQSPTDPHSLRAFSEHLFQHGTSQEAEEALQYVLAAAPDDASAHHNLATIRMKTGQHAVAIGDCLASLKHRPKFAPTYVSLGYAFLGAGQLAEATEAWRQALSIDPLYAPAMQALERSWPTCEHKSQVHPIATAAR
jgi:tetratricopeptide (TPR) repeat protein